VFLTTTSIFSFSWTSLFFILRYACFELQCISSKVKLKIAYS